MEIEIRKLADLKRNPKNIRKHSEKQIEEYMRSIKMWGQTRPMLIDEDGLILAGNGMYDALTKMGKEECEVYVMRGLTPTQKDKVMLSDNKVFDLGVNDLGAIEEVIRGLGDDLDIPGYDDKILELITATVSEATQAVAEYGKVEPLPQPEAQGEAPVRHTPADFGVTQQQVQEAQAPIPYQDAPVPEQRKSIVCPKCGEVIWL